MNPKMHEMYLEAQKSVVFLSNSRESKERIAAERFAEAIIKECCRMMIELEVKYPANLTTKKIKEEFGILSNE